MASNKSSSTSRLPKDTTTGDQDNDFKDHAAIAGPEDAPIKDLLQMMASQQKLLVDLLQRMATPTVAPQDSLFDRVSRRLDKFSYEADQEDCFNLWFNRHKDVFEVDCQGMDDAMKARLLVAALDAPSHTRFVRYILPKEPRDLDWSDTLETLKTLFGTKKSLFRRRFECFRMNFSPNEDINSFVNLLKARTLEANFKDIRQETLECLALKRKKHRLPPPAKPRLPPSPCPICHQQHWKKDCPQNRNATSAAQESRTAPRRRNKQSSPRTWYQRAIGRSGDVQKYLEVHINGHPTRLQLDTGADVTIISRPTWMQLGSPRLQKTSDVFKGANGLPLPIHGRFNAAFVVVDNQGKAHPGQGVCYVSDDNDLLGITWIEQIQDFNSVLKRFNIQKVQTLNYDAIRDKTIVKLKHHFADVFKPELGCCTKAKATLYLKPDAYPVFIKKRPVPYASVPLLDAEIDRLVAQNVISAVDHSQWAAPIVVVRKANGSIRLCADFSTGLNDALQLHRHPLPTAEDVFTKLNGGTVFSQIDFADAYLQVEKGVPAYSANRLQRWRLTLLAYDFSIEYRNTTSFGQADALSRLISAQSPPEEDVIIAKIAGDVNAIFHDNVSRLPVTAKDVARATAEDDCLRQVLDHVVHNNWPKKPSPIVANYAHLRNDLSTQQGGLLFGSRIIIPPALQPIVMKALHEGHPGMNRMKALARSHVFWTKINDDLEKLVRTCAACQEAAKSPVKNTLCSWSRPDAPWSRIHIDFAGPIDGISYLVVVDAFSKWPEVIPMTSTTSIATLRELRRLFAQFGLPQIIVSDNGTQFTSAEFQDFCRSNGIKHVRSPPFHPQSNGQAERFVDTFKRSLAKMKSNGPTVDALHTFLFTYRNTPLTRTPSRTGVVNLRGEVLGRHVISRLLCMICVPYVNYLTC
ncbi:integrase core domain protein [Teladorsagia circumcincta]|uniref:RNA-directed DNA polymerase n=1 Tax=Teladorsagia circumcincta TaxID=45464 RepID=A0A2G9UXB4_TELCI|nr:integrase core domain protein [Teladorsagia circumcincta]